ncbi:MULTISPECIES: hypothetical protein [unclassified Enterococcus]|uniref:hypothetical protein n=1 Tax=unclassified Enterococcus TaxID=2608891 RepID=UPI0019046696|nr:MULTISPECIES: hypothetical protein [unclassified Enterococcus]MBK0038003.1 hypothetical protein [Enterococcus sp. S52]MBK0070678.1 hypothetical protein [Enterococcus sp. S53]MBK0141329.1 hypothetical protein [Enterococcus sp. S76]MBK0144717.1 hypothetical protein [Enterococcus sp. S77]
MILKFVDVKETVLQDEYPVIRVEEYQNFNYQEEVGECGTEYTVVLENADFEKAKIRVPFQKPAPFYLCEKTSRYRKVSFENLNLHLVIENGILQVKGYAEKATPTKKRD